MTSRSPIPSGYRPITPHGGRLTFGHVLREPVTVSQQFVVIGFALVAIVAVVAVVYAVASSRTRD